MARHTAWALLGATAALGWATAPLALADAGTSAISTSVVNQVTGMASDADRGLTWVAGASGAKVYAVDQASGATRRTVGYEATPVDVEALAYRDQRLWIGDIGDPQASRRSVTLYRLGSFADGSTVTPRQYVLRYPDGAHDAGAMTISARGRAYVVTRGARPGIYRTPEPPVSGGTVNTLERLADAPEGVTDAVFTGSDLVLRTGNGLYAYDSQDFKKVAQGPLAAGLDGAGLTTSAGGKLLVSGAGRPATLSQVAVPTGNAAIPTASPTPSASASPSGGSGVAGAVSGVEKAAGRATKGTVGALVAAGAISLAAAAVVVLKR